MPQHPEGPETQDFQLFSKRFEQLIKHKNHIIEVLQEELQRLRPGAGSNTALAPESVPSPSSLPAPLAVAPPSQPEDQEKIEELTSENRYLRNKLEELKTLTAKDQFEDVHQLELELQAVRRDNQLLQQQLKSSENKVKDLSNLTPERQAELSFGEIRLKNEEIENLKSRLGELLVVQNRADLTHRDLNQKILELSQEVQDTETQRIRTQEHLEGKNRDIERLEEESNRLQGEIGRLRALIADLQDKIATQTRIIQDERTSGASLQQELDAERKVSAQLIPLKAELTEMQAKEQSLQFLIETLKGNLASVSDRFSRFLFGNQHRKTIFRAGIEAEISSGEQTIENPEFRLLLPFCFPEHPPRLLPNIRPRLAYSRPVLADKDRLLRVYKPIPFIKTYLQVALPAPLQLKPRLKLLPLQITERPAAVPPAPLIQDAASQKAQEQGVYFSNQFALLSVIPVHRSLPAIESRLPMTRSPLQVYTNSPDLFLDFLQSSLLRTFKQKLKFLDYSQPRTIPRKPQPLATPFQPRTQMKMVPYDFFRSSLSRLPSLSSGRRFFPQSFPRGGISMLVKGVSDSLSALSSRLELPDLTKATQKRHNDR
jgi:hypothetical protein